MAIIKGHFFGLNKFLAFPILERLAHGWRGCLLEFLCLMALRLVVQGDGALAGEGRRNKGCMSGGSAPEVEAGWVLEGLIYKMEVRDAGRWVRGPKGHTLFQNDFLS